MKEKGTDESLSSPKVRRLGSQPVKCGDVVGVLTLFVGGVAQASSEWRKEQVEVEREKRIKEVRSWI